jgi:hypothetical protein
MDIGGDAQDWPLPWSNRTRDQQAALSQESDYISGQEESTDGEQNPVNKETLRLGKNKARFWIKNHKSVGKKQSRTTGKQQII